eukprot:1586754-Amphidinium_carterae.1
MQATSQPHAIFRWPDWELPERFVRGFRLSGYIAPSNLFTTLPYREGRPAEDLLGAEADTWNQLLTNERRSADTTELIGSGTLKEQYKGIVDPPLTKKQMDRRFGKGQWRALPRRLLWQESHNKHRMIDNARTSEHNMGTLVTETIFTTPLDVTVQVLRCLRERFQQPLSGPLQPFLSSEDLKDAYRSIPIDPYQQNLAVVAYRPHNTRAVHFSECKAMLFGLLSAVTQFNRVPAFLNAMARRVFGLMSWHFFDDSGIITLEEEHKSHLHGGQLLRYVNTSLGFPHADAKHQAPGLE